jgi:hypothetical protein
MTTTLLRPQDLNEIISDAEMKKMEEERQRKQRREQEQRELREAFMARDIHPEVMDRLNKVIRIAAEQGLKEVQVVTFPASFCKDGGRRINNLLPDWPDSTRGVREEGLRLLPERAASARVQAACASDRFPRWNAR